MIVPTPPTKTEQDLELLKKQNEKLAKINTELANKNATLEGAILLHESTILELVSMVFSEDNEVM